MDNKVKEYRRGKLSLIIMLAFITSMFTAVSVYVSVDFASINYKEKYDELYEHQLEYLMDEPVEYDDRYERENICRLIAVDYTYTGEYEKWNGKSYYKKINVRLTNTANEPLYNVKLKVPYRQHYIDEISYFEVMVGTVLKEGKEFTIELPEPAVVYDWGLVTLKGCTQDALCYTYYTEEGYSYSEAIEEIDHYLIDAVLGGKPVAKTSEEKLRAIPVYVITGLLYLALLILIVNVLQRSKEVARGEYEIINGEVVPKSKVASYTKAREIMSKLIDEEDKEVLSLFTSKQKKKEEEDKEVASALMPADFDDGHPTTHDCGGFDINEDDFKIDPNDY